MARLIPNENTWFAFSLTCPTPHSVAKSLITGAVTLTSYLMSVNATTTGNTVPTPALDRLFETSIPGTVQASFSADFYRDDEDDLAWETFPRKTTGFVFLSRFGGSDTTVLNRPTTGDKIEVWPIRVVSRANSNSTNNSVLSFTMTASIPEEPVEDAVVAS